MGLGELLEKDVVLMHPHKVNFLNRITPKIEDVVIDINQTAFCLTEAQAQALAKELAFGRLKIRFKYDTPPAIGSAFEIWGGRHANPTIGLNECVRRILEGVAEKGQNGSREG